MSQRFADLPMMAERVGDVPHSSTVGLVLYGRDDGGSGLDDLIEELIEIVDRDDEPHGAAAERLGAEVQMLGRFHWRARRWLPRTTVDQRLIAGRRKCGRVLQLPRAIL